ncbi:MAG: stage II sporulation protein P [Oscillibacter sp.]|nr:stage II sporulation protein P [Oscillibacter sp.]
MNRKTIRDLAHRALALAVAGGTLWAVAVTAGSTTASESAAALRAALPVKALKWELGDLRQEDALSPATVLALSQSPLLVSARSAVAELWSSEREEQPSPDTHREEIVTRPVEETPLEAPAAPDNGVAARTLVPTSTEGYTVWGKVYISNSTDHAIPLTELDAPFAAELTGEEGPQVLILHSHGSEAYTPAEDDGIVWSGDHRTTDSRYNVVQVGEEIAGVLSRAGISVLHDRTLYDYPNYTGAYDRSLAAIRTYQAQYPSLRFILDVHRDAIEDGQGNEYKVVSAVGEETAAQMTLVMGSDGSGLEHPDWMENLKLAAALQQDILTEFSTLMRPILLRNSRYNQHVSAGALLLEVGAAGNSPEEAALAGRLFAERMVEVLTARSK